MGDRIIMTGFLNRAVWILAILALGVAACTIDTESLPKIDTDSLPRIGRNSTVAPIATSVGAATPFQASNPEPSVVQGPTQTTASAVTPTNSPSLITEDIEVRKRIAILRNASRTLAAWAAEPTPIGLEGREAKQFAEYSNWLKLSSEQIDALIEKTEESRASNQMRSTKEMQEMNQSFNLQYLGLQQKMQADNRKFTLMSNIMKKKHEKAREVINNVR